MAAEASAKSPSLDPRFIVYDTVFGKDTMERVRASKILVVGAGGIGCELLKDLVLAGFKRIDVVDLDTIDVSNLNRQFLFRPHHVGASKAAVAAVAVSSFVPGCEITAIHGNIIKGRQFTADYFAAFDLVINALDNQAARSHVNRMCLATERPLVEGGSTGFMGQAHSIVGGSTMCYDCEPKPTQKTYPVCTIRSTPDKPVHCIVWAKELHKLLFGDAPSSVLYEPDDPEPAAGATGAAASAAAAAAPSSPAAAGVAVPAGESVYMRAVRRPDEAACSDPAALRAWARGVFDAVFRLEIEKKLSMGDTYKTAKHAPTPLGLDECLGGAAAGTAAEGRGLWDAALPGQRPPTVAECAAAFLSACTSFFSREETRATAGSFAFDKDHPISMRLVAAAANLRAHTFGIELLSEFEIKSIAGNIVPAVATTNAIVAGLEALEAVRLLSGRAVAAACSYTNVATTGFAGGRTLLGGAPRPPVRGCHACGRRRVVVRVDTRRVTLGAFLERAVKGSMAFEAPGVLFQACSPAADGPAAAAGSGGSSEQLGEGGGSHFSFVEGEDEDSWLAVPLAELPAGGVTSGKIVTVDDWELDGARVEVVIAHVEAGDGPPEEAIEVVGSFSAVDAAREAAQAKAAQLKAAQASRAAKRAQDMASARKDDGELVLLDDDDDDHAGPTVGAVKAAADIDSPATSSSGSRKRLRSPGEDGSKRAKDSTDE